MAERRLLQIFSAPPGAPGGVEQIMSAINRVAESLGYATSALHAGDLPPAVFSRRFPMLNTPYDIHRLASRYRSQIEGAEVVISHGMWGAFVSHPRHIYVFHSTYADMVEASRPSVDRLTYTIGKYLFSGLLEHRCARRARRCVAVSQPVADSVVRHHGVSPMLIPNCLPRPPLLVDRAEARAWAAQRWGLGEGTWFLAVGRRERLKGLDRLRIMASHLPAGASLLSVGSGPEVPGMLCLEGLAEVEVMKLYRAVDWVLMPSLYEGFGLTLLEAVAHETPVLAGAVGIVPEYAAVCPAEGPLLLEDSHETGHWVRFLQRACEGQIDGRAQLAALTPHLEPLLRGLSFVRRWSHLIRAVTGRVAVTELQGIPSFAAK